MLRRTREAGGSIKPGAQAPGNAKTLECFEPAIAGVSALTTWLCRPLRGLTSLLLFSIPGACAPGFMLPPASRVRSLLLTRSNSTYPLRGFGPVTHTVQFNLPRLAGSVPVTHTVQFNLAAYNIDRYLNRRLVVG